MDKGVIFYSMHRSGSTAQIDLLKYMAKYTNTIHRYFAPAVENFNVGKSKTIHQLPPGIARSMSPKKGVYGPFRRFTEVPNLKDYNVIMSLRDPRDVLVSLYYSNVFYHSPPKDPTLAKKFLNNRKKNRAEGIDKFSLNSADSIFKIYNEYKKAYEKYPALLVTYAEMVMNYKSYIKKILDYCGCSEIHKDMLRFEKSFQPPKKENVKVHKRQYLPKDYQRKLKPNTITQLTTKFKPILTWIEKNKS